MGDQHDKGNDDDDDEEGVGHLGEGVARYPLRLHLLRESSEEKAQKPLVTNRELKGRKPLLRGSNFFTSLETLSGTPLIPETSKLTPSSPTNSD